MTTVYTVYVYTTYPDTERYVKGVFTGVVIFSRTILTGWRKDPSLKSMIAPATTMDLCVRSQLLRPQRKNRPWG